MLKFTTTKTIDIAELRIGMYVTRLEVPWSSTEFSLQGTLIRDRQDILKLSQYGRKVVIDQAKCSNRNQQAVLLPLVQKTRNKQKINVYKQSPRPWRKFCKQNYLTTQIISKEIPKAKQIIETLDAIFSSLKSDIKHIEPTKIDEIKKVSQQLVSSLLNNTDALLWLTKIKTNYTKVYEHSLRCAIWATLMGRSMGLIQISLNILVQAILLASVGKAYLNKAIWLNYHEERIHPDYALYSNLSIEKLSHCKNIEPQVLTILANMTERFDGSGYPAQKDGQNIPYLSQIAALVESFDLILNPLFKTKQLTFGQALSKLYCLADSMFDGVLVEEFIQATGLYPAGTQVLLSDGYYGVVIEQSKERRLQATVALTHDSEGYRLLNYKMARLGEKQYQNTIILQESDKHSFVEDDMRRINQLINKSQSNPFSRFITSIF